MIVGASAKSGNQETQENDDNLSAKMTMGLNMVRKAKKGMIEDNESVENGLARIIHEQIRNMKRIETQLQAKVWVWDKDVGHKLFNFHEGYETLPTFPPLVGSCKSFLSPPFFRLKLFITVFCILDIVSKFNKNNVIFQQARKFHSLPITKHAKDEDRKAMYKIEAQKLMQIMYHDGNYYLHEPFPDKKHKRDPDLIIEKHCWLVLKYLQKMRSQVQINDVVRFGRVTFKVTELVLTKEDIENTKMTLDALKNAT